MRRSRGQSDGAREEGEKLAPLTLRYPRAALAVSFVVIAVLVGFGINLEEKLSPSTLEINGTASSRANEMVREHFGDSSPFPILLQGPPAELDRQGPALIRALRRDPKVTTLSPWDQGNVERLRPAPGRVIIIANFHTDADEAVDVTVPELNRTLEEKISPPVRATQTGFATLVREIEEKSISASERGELIALPILLVVLLLVFRSPVAAAIPLGFGAIAVFSSRGLLAILTEWFGVGALALTVCTMMGLALGVDYALLLVSRFREELARGADPLEAAWVTRRTAGRTTIFAGSTLVLSMLVAFLIAPGSLLKALAGTLSLVVVLTVLVATVVGPPILVLLGKNIDRWRIGGATDDGERSRLMTVVSAALRRPAPVAAAIAAVVLVLAGPAVALKTGPFSLGELPPDNQIRNDAEEIQDAIGSGFEAPYEIIVSADRGTITEPDRLAVLSRFQRRIAKEPGIQFVVGPEEVSRAVEPLREAGSGILASDSDSGPVANFARLGRSLGRLADGVTQLRAGIAQATNGVSLLADGSGQAEDGALAIAQGLGRAATASQNAVSGLERFSKGARRLANAQRQASNGALALKLNLPPIATNLRRNGLRRSHLLQGQLFNEANNEVPPLEAAAQAADAQLKAALQQLEAMTVGKSDPSYAPALEAVRQATAAVTGTNPATGQPFASEYAGLPAELAALRTRLLADAEQAQEVSRWISSETAHIESAAKFAKRLSEGLFEIAKGGNRFANGAERIEEQTSRLADGLSTATSLQARLGEALGQLTGGAVQIEEGLGEGYSRSYPAQAGLRRANVQVLSQSASVERRLGNLRNTSPGIFNSGYFVLSALDGTRGQLRERASEAVDVEGGGQAATVGVFPRYTFNSPGSIALNEILEDDAAQLAKEADVEAGVAGGAATLNTYSEVTRDRIPFIIAAITLATFLVLVFVLRALPLAAIAVGLNLATVAVAFGILTLLFNVPEGWPLGGRTYVSAVGATMIFGIVFGLSIDYAVFLLVRMREHYDKYGDNARAIEFGLEKTARVITGAAAIMMAVFIAFAGAPIATVSQLGVGLTIAVLLDATVVRIVLLPALMLLIGDRVWWLPRSLERAMPRLNV